MSGSSPSDNTPPIPERVRAIIDRQFGEGLSVRKIEFSDDRAVYEGSQRFSQLQGLGNPLPVYEIDTDMVGAFYIPAVDSVIMTRGILDMLNDIEARTVLAHEVAHASQTKGLLPGHPLFVMDSANARQVECVADKAAAQMTNPHDFISLMLTLKENEREIIGRHASWIDGRLGNQFEEAVDLCENLVDYHGSSRFSEIGLKRGRVAIVKDGVENCDVILKAQDALRNGRLPESVSHGSFDERIKTVHEDLECPSGFGHALINGEVFSPYDYGVSPQTPPAQPQKSQRPGFSKALILVSQTTSCVKSLILA